MPLAPTPSTVFRSDTAPAPPNTSVERGGMRGVWDLFREGRGPWLLFLSAVLTGFFHGWMKLHYRSSVVTFAFDIPLTLAYGLQQSPAEVRAMIESDPYLAYRLQGNFFGSTEGSQFRVLRDVRGTALDTVLLPAGAWFLISALCMPIGSPFLSIPVGPLTWFLLGSIVRLHEARAAEVHPELAPMKSLRHQPFTPVRVHSEDNSPVRPEKPGNRARRFLYERNPAVREEETRR